MSVIKAGKNKIGNNFPRVIPASLFNPKRHIFALIILFCLAGSPAFALNFWPEGGFAGIGPEINIYSRAGLAFGGALILGIDFNDDFSAGLKTAFFDNFDTIGAFETLLFFRYYLPWLHLPKSTDGPFAQIEAGSVILFERGYYKNLEAFPSFSGGLSAGWRFNFGGHWYLEPSMRTGYPHIWGLNVTAGIRFKREVVTKEPLPITVYEQEKPVEEPEEIVEQESPITEPIYSPANVQEHLLVISDGDKLRIITPFIVFRANHADFMGLSAEIINRNLNTLKRIVEIANKFSDYRILVEGHANPTTGPLGRKTEEPSLKKLSENRAKMAVEELVRLGVDRNRLLYSGESGSKLVVPYNDYNNAWKNRRVDFFLIK
jgi:outer membrane protein OmpA-like peptidoglycan-associated protein